MSQLFQDIKNLQDDIERFNQLIEGDDTTVVSMADGQYKPSVSMAILSHFAAISANVQGRITYETLAELNGDLNHAENTMGEVWNDPSSSNNGLYGKLGASGSGSWQKSPYDPATLLSNDIYNAALKYDSGVDTAGQVFNGAEWWDGTTSVGATPQSGGWRVPAGQTGANSYNRYYFRFTAEESAALAGRKVRFVVMLKTTTDFLNQFVGFSHQVEITGTAGEITNKTYYQDSPNYVVISWDYRFTGDETQVNSYLQVSGAQTALASEAWIVAQGQHYGAVDAAGSGEVLDKRISEVETNVENIQESVKEATLSSGDKSTVVEIQAGVFNGASLTTNGVTIPAGSTGLSSYNTYMVPLEDMTEFVGATIRFRMELTTSDDFLTKMGLGSGINGSQGTNLHIPGSIKIETLDTNTVLIQGDYILQGSVTEKMGLYAQINSASDTSEERSFVLKNVSYTVVDSGVEGTSSNGVMLESKLNQLDVGSGELKSYLSTEGQQFNGGEVYDGGYGIFVPSGQSGQTTYRRYKLDAALLQKYVGSTIQIVLFFNTSTDLTDETGLRGGLSIYYTDQSPNYDVQSAKVSKIDSTTMRLEWNYTIPDNLSDIGPYVQINSAGLRTTDGFITLDSFAFMFISSPTDSRESILETAIDYRSRLASTIASNPSEVEYIQIIEVKPDGTGNYTTLKDACANAVGESRTRRVLIKVYEGVYTDTNYHLPNHVDVVGVGQRDLIWLRGYLPEDTALSTIPTVQTIWFNYTSKIKNMKITAQNMRYPIHSDSGASSNRALQEIEDCYVEHYGNQEARDWQENNGGNPGGVWGSEHAWGCGTHSGQHIISKRTHWVSATSPWYFHTNKDFDEPCLVEVDESHIDCRTEGGNAIVVQALGSGQPDRLSIKDSIIRGMMLINDSPWLSSQLYNQRANRMEVEITISGSGSVAWNSTQTAQALELRSSESATSSVEVSGEGADVLFGTLPDTREGGTGYPGRVYSTHSINNTSYITTASLGARLGDLTSSPIDLNITFDGTVNRTITLDQDYSALDNTTIVGLLNADLNDANRSFYISDPWEGRATVYQPEYESIIQNTGSTAILRGMGVVYDGGKFYGRVATSTDDVGLFMGVAIEDIIPGKRGRVGFGAIYVGNLLKVGTPSNTFNTKLAISSTDGYFEESATNVVLNCVIERGVYEVIR